jgi:hypothetical protein
MLLNRHPRGDCYARQTLTVIQRVGAKAGVSRSQPGDFQTVLIRSFGRGRLFLYGIDMIPCPPLPCNCPRD